MKNLLLFFGILVIIENCESGKNQGIIKDKNSKTTELISNESKTFIKDTIISCDNYCVKINIIKEPIKGKLFDGELDNRVQLKITLENDTIFNKIYNKNYFKIENTSFLQKAVLYSFLFDSVNCSVGMYKFFCGIGVPETDWTYAFEIYIDNKGLQKIYELDQEGTQKLRPDIK